jgi:hypothetical protein
MIPAKFQNGVGAKSTDSRLLFPGWLLIIAHGRTHVHDLERRLPIDLLDAELFRCLRTLVWRAARRGKMC